MRAGWTRPHEDHSACERGRHINVGRRQVASARAPGPAKGTFSRAGTLTMTTAYGTATFLPDGTVLVAGGGSARADRYQGPLPLT